MTNKKWHSGPPPSLGWWPASMCQNSTAYRWWNGEYWSVACFEYHSMSSIVRRLTVKTVLKLSEIQWQHRPKSWPERSKT